MTKSDDTLRPAAPGHSHPHAHPHTHHHKKHHHAHHAHGTHHASHPGAAHPASQAAGDASAGPPKAERDNKALQAGKGPGATIGLPGATGGPATNQPANGQPATAKQDAKPLAGKFLATAYFPSNSKMEGGFITSTGHKIHTLEEAQKDGKPVTAAVDPKVVPIGTHFTLKEFPGVTFLADDVGGAIKGHHIDIAMANGHAANAWGKRTVDN
jgi:3D (Asp-Asp-Asp) domain-containing protein